VTTLEESREVTELSYEHADAEALIKEARRLRRLRYLRIGTGGLIVATAVGVGVALNQSGGDGSSNHHESSGSKAPRAATPLPPAPKPPGVVLPTTALFNQITVTPSGLLLTGVTDAAGENPEGPCVSAPVDPQSLAVGNLAVGSCGDPLLFGRTVEAVTTNVPRSNNATISIDVANPTTGAVTYGPTVMTYGSYSDTRPVIVNGTQWLWIYDAETTNGAELLQVSMRSGAVVDTIAMPQLYRPFLAADDGGVWVANSENEIPAAPALSFVPAGSSAPDVVVSGPLPMCWLSAAGTSAWVGAGLQGGCAKQTTERFEDDGQAAAYSTPTNYTPGIVIGDEESGLWTMNWSASGQEILSIDPDTGSESVAATVPSVQEPLYTDAGLAEGQAVHFDGALYLLEPPFRLNGYQGYTSIVRVVPATAR
jgi:hypothetical protein